MGNIPDRQIIKNNNKQKGFINGQEGDNPIEKWAKAIRRHLSKELNCPHVQEKELKVISVQRDAN